MNSKKQLIQGLVLCALSLCAMNAMAIIKMVNDTNTTIKVETEIPVTSFPSGAPTGETTPEVKTLKAGESCDLSSTNKLKLNGQKINTLVLDSQPKLNTGEFHQNPDDVPFILEPVWVIKQAPANAYSIDVQWQRARSGRPY